MPNGSRGDYSMILERDTELAELRQLLDDLDSSGGRVVLVRGEAGIGKSALITQLIAETQDRAHVLVGACDDLLTPQPLGPIWDIARHDSSVAAPLAQGDRRAVMEILLDLLSRKLRPTVLVLEDTQWVGEATLDVIKFLGRRIARTNGLLILTYRDGVVDADHPLRQVIGELPPQNLIRMHLHRLSAAAIASMIGGKHFDLDEVLALTGGNPLFVTEVVASGIETVPSSVQDSVLARAFKISPAARRVLELVSVVPGEAERSLVEKILHPTHEQYAECVRQGLLRVVNDTVGFAHELQRRAIESSLKMADRRHLNQRVLTVLEGKEDPARLVHHAREAGDIEAIIEFAPMAARAAMAIESNREAVAHFRTLEPYIDRIAPTDQATILDDWAREEFYLDNAASLDLVDRAIQLHRSLGDDRALARTLTFAVRVHKAYLRTEKALAYAAEAVSILESYPPSADLAYALSGHAFIHWLSSEDIAASLDIADRAMSIAETTGDDLAIIHALNTKGNIEHTQGDETAMSLLEESRRRAELAGYQYDEVRALGNMTGMAGDVRDVERAADFAQRARDTAARYEMRTLEADAQAMYAEILQWKGDWTAAEDAASEVLGANPSTETLAWRVLGTLQARRGRSEARAALDRMWSLAETSEQLTVLDPAAAVLAEYLWFSGEDDSAWIERLREVLDMGVRAGLPWPSGAFAFWMWKLGLLETVPRGSADFYGWIIRGDYQIAADFWRERGVPYEEGLALMHGDEAEQIEAIRIFEKLGAAATANRVRRALLDRGVSVPRGRSQSTRDHAAGLTARQAEVLELLVEDLTNTEIADRLFVSYRTVEKHVAAILMKLDVPTRDVAVDAARGRGILAAP